MNDQHPSLGPEGETVLPNDVLFTNECLSRFAEELGSNGWRITESVLTQSGK